MSNLSSSQQSLSSIQQSLLSSIQQSLLFSSLFYLAYILLVLPTIYIFIHVVKQLPDSSNKDIFEESAPHFNTILKNSGFHEKIEFNKNQPTNQRRKNRQRNIIWYNPPFSKNVKTNIAKKFLNIVKKHFPKEHKFYKLFNKNNIKISYSCMDNMKKILNSHNKKLLSDKPESTTLPINTCNCRNKTLCPLDGSCLTSGVIYKAEVINTNTGVQKNYIGLAETPFKTRYSNHLKSFKHKKYENETELSKHVWLLKEQNQNFEIKWSILRKSNSYNPISKSCNLCLTEKLMLILEKNKGDLLNKRSEMVSKCRHQNKYILENN